MAHVTARTIEKKEVEMKEEGTVPVMTDLGMDTGAEEGKIGTGREVEVEIGEMMTD